MIPSGFVNHIFVLAAVFTILSGSNHGEDVCSSHGGFCGAAKCSPVNGNETFSCDCGNQHYFNATSKRCIHRASCQIIPCHLSICVDNDGHSEATCTCDGFPDMTSDCQVDPAFKKQCDANGGTVRMASEDGRAVPKCECRVGTKQLGNGECKSIACLLPNLTCEEICSDGKLREDHRCCQNWNKDRCNEPPQSGEFCVPGTIWNETGKSCTNACAASESGPVCGHACTYTDIRAPAYQCKCQHDEVVSPDGLYCKVKSECSDNDVQTCSSQGRLCSVEKGKVQCNCPANTVEDADNCSDTCSSEKARHCSSLFSTCIVKENTETCTCHYPLRWDTESKQCILDEQYKYVVFFKRPDSDGPSSSPELCGDPIQDKVINTAMKNLYGLHLREARIVNCSSKMSKIELTFIEDPPTAVLQRIRLCESGGQICSFPPHLRIERGSVSGPVAVDLCHTYFEKLGAVSNGTYRCSRLSHGRYLIDCSSVANEKGITSGSLELRLCSADDGEKEDRGAMWDYKATLAYSAIPVLAIVVIVLLVVLGCRRRYCFYSPAVDAPEYNAVKFRGIENLAEDGEPTIEVTKQRCDTTDTPRKQNRVNEAALLRDY